MDGITSLEFAALVKRCHAQVYKVLPSLSPGMLYQDRLRFCPARVKFDQRLYTAIHP
jgi:hypothetical protein